MFFEQVKQEITSAVWVMKEAALSMYEPSVIRMFRGEMSFAEAKALIEEREAKGAVLFYSVDSERILNGPAPRSASINVQSSWQLDDIEEDSIAVISLQGALLKTTGLCNKGTEETLAELQKAGNHAKIRGVVMKIFSPGGSVYGTENLAKEVAEFSTKYGKPIAALIDDQACSGAYWVASQADRIFVANNSSEAGCIGTMMSYLDLDGKMKLEGIQRIVVRATDSFNKGEEFNQAKQGNFEPMQKQILDPMNSSFMGMVKKARKGKIDLEQKVQGVPEVLTGKTYYGQDIVRVGLADEMGSLDVALKYVDNEYRRMKREKEAAAAAKSNAKAESNNSGADPHLSNQQNEETEMGLKQWFSGLFQSKGVTSMKDKDGKEVTVENFISGLTTAEAEEFNREAMTEIANQAATAAANDAIKAANEKAANEKKAEAEKLQASIDALSTKLDGLTAKFTETEKLASALQKEVAVLKGAPSASGLPSDGDKSKMGAGGDDESSNLDASAYADNAQIRTINSLKASGAISQEKYNKMISETVANLKKEKVTK